MLLRHLASNQSVADFSWQELELGVPTIAGFAQLCSRAIGGAIPPADELDRYAQALLSAASLRGMFDLRGNKEAFDSSDRLLAVCVEREPDCHWLFRPHGQPRETMRFLEGFRQLCQYNLVVHHTLREFSLTSSGFDMAEQIHASDVQELFKMAIEVEH